MRMTRGRGIAVALATVALTITLSACDQPPPPAQARDAAASAQSVGRIIENQPIKSGQYSPSRDTMNAWVNTWMSGPGKKAYTYFYIQGAPVGYYVLTGPPVSYAIGGTEPYRTECYGNGQCVQKSNPGQDATFANAGSGQFQFYGKDATTGRMLEFGGVGVTYFLSDKPLPIPAPPLGDTK